jgi:glutamate transport system permease protein
MSSILYDAPGPRARARNRVLAVVFGLVFLGLAWFVYDRFKAKGQWTAAKWKPLVQGDVWTTYILPGIRGTLEVALVAGVLALVFGAVFGIGRLSDHWWLRAPSAVVVEFFRSIPLLVLIFFAFFGSFAVLGVAISAFSAVLFGLTLYNGSVIAEIVRAGVRAVPRGQSEAAYAIGLRKGAVMRIILLPQAIRSMLPVLLSQLVVLLKDSALGYIIGYTELLRQTDLISAQFGNVVPASILIAAVYIAMNLMLGWAASWLERRSRRRGQPTMDDAQRALELETA